MISSSSIRNATMLYGRVLPPLSSLLIRMKIRGVIEPSRYRARLDLNLIKKLELDRAFFPSNVQNLTRKIVELLELDSRVADE